MSILSTPWIADNIARLFSALINPAPHPAVRFPDVNADTSTVVIPTRHGNTQATIYHPPHHPGPPPAVYVNVHGGGFVVDHREQDDPWCRYLAAKAGIVVINTDYVLAPARRFPAAVEQIYDVVTWASAQGHGWDGTRLCVGGQSAGGNLSAAAARLALELGTPSISLQVLHYPPLDLVTRTADKPSPLGRRAIMRPWMGEVFDTAYIPDPAQRRDPLASPAWGSNGDGLNGIAPALIVTAEYDRLRAEAKRYADKLRSDGALAAYHEVRAVDHGYNIMSDDIDVTRRTYDVMCEHVVTATHSD